MSETTTATAARPPARSEPKILGMPRTAVLIGAAVFIGAAIWFLVKRRQSKAAASTAGQPSECTDSQGNPVPCVEASGIDYSGQLSAIQTELESLLAAGGTPAAGGGGGTGAGTGSSGDGSGAGPGTAPDMPPSPGGTTTMTAKIPASPGGLRVVKTTSDSITISWSAVPGATGYMIRVTYQSQLVKQQPAGTATTATISGLGADHTYGLHVIATNASGWSPAASTIGKTKR